MKHLAIAKRLNQVIKVEAKDTSEAYFLATHKPFEKLKYVPRNMKKDEVDFVHEEEFFNSVFDHMDQHHFVMVTGDNGSGKSHLIRWVKEQLSFSGLIDNEKETVLFISRAQSTLRGALEQIINAKAFQESDMTEKLRKLVQANEHLSKDGLKQRIIHHFAIAVEEDGENSNFSSRDRKELYSFLVDQDTQRFLMGESGPIERIQKKLASEARNEVMTDVTPRYEPSDFSISLSQLETVKRSDVGKRALRFVESVADSTNSLEQQEIHRKRERYAAYLNNFLDRVVQECTQFRGTDLADIFKLLRQELKRNGKSLTLLIEDITSFTGIDKALMDVLAYTHQGTEYDESLCRLISIVGVTNWYYDTSINDNFKERVTANVYVDDAFGEVSDVVDMTARYLNAIYVEPHLVDTWLQNGARKEHLPIANVFKEHEWAHIKIDEYTMTLFPFNQTVLGHFHEKKELRTPRRFLQDVILKYVHWMTVHGTEMFPPEYTSFGLDVAWKDSNDDAVLKRESAPNLVNRYMSLFRIWGDRTLDAFTTNEVKVVGGLSEDVFRSFGLPLLKGHTVTSSIGNGNRRTAQEPIAIGQGTKPSSENGLIVNRLNPKDIPSGESKRGGNNKVISPPPDYIEPAPSQTNEDPKEKRFRETEREIEKWMDGEKLISKLLEELINVVNEFIRWEDNGVSALQVKEYFNTRRVTIEDYFNNMSAVNTLIFQRSHSLKYALLALAAWKERGAKSWDFNGAEEYALALYDWMSEQEKNIIEFTRDPFQTGTSSMQMNEYTTMGQLVAITLSGSLTGTILTVEGLYQELANYILPVKVDVTRDSKWQALQRLLPSDPKELSERFLRHFNLVQGEIKNGTNTPVFYLQVAKILPVLEKVLKDDWAFDQLSLPERPRSKGDAWYQSIHLLHDIVKSLPEATRAEYSKAEQFSKHLQNLIGEDINEVGVLFDEMKEMLNWLTAQRENYDPASFDWLKSNHCNPSLITPHLHAISLLTDRKGEASQFIGLSQDPISILRPYHEAIVNFHNLLDQLESRYKQRLSQSSQASNATTNVEEKTKIILKTWYEELQLLSEEVLHAKR
ncbi:hypothetical protein [Paenibacillus sp. 37]|uniref:hypothetical protein n=1 Tax=Paenibacillus sp. 37 TaxID=2607911 RepID=UPI00122DDDB9|nr:hypothetical protein [Paenibacillus sp. 37]